MDPLTKSYPWYTPYQFAGNKPIWAIDLDGLEELIYTRSFAAYKFDVHWTVMTSKHLGNIMRSVSRPERAQDIKIYFGSDEHTTGKENGYTSNLINAARVVLNFENEFSEELNDPTKFGQLYGTKQMAKRTNNYLDASDDLDRIGLSAEEIVKRSDENPNLQMLLVSLTRSQAGYGKEAMKTFYHELELHVARMIGERINLNGSNSGAADHDYGHFFYKNREYYEERDYTEADLKAGFSPNKADIIEDSPTGTTNKEIDSVY